MTSSQIICPHCGAQLNFGLEITPGMAVDCLVCMANFEAMPGMALVSESPQPALAATTQEPLPLPATPAPTPELPPTASVPPIPLAKSEAVLMSLPFAPPQVEESSVPAAPPVRRGSDYLLFGVLSIAACIGLFFALAQFQAGDEEIDEPKPPVVAPTPLAQGPEPPQGGEAPKKDEQGRNLFGGWNSKDTDINPVLVAPKKKKQDDELLSVVLPRALADSDAELYAKAMELAKQSLESGNYDQAVVWFQIAGKLHHNDQVMQGLQLAESRRTASMIEASRQRLQAERESRLAGYERWMVKGKASLFLQEFDKAVDFFQQALKLFPDDTRARESLAEVEVARRRMQALQTEEQRRLALLRERRAIQSSEDFKRAMTSGNQALNRGSFLQALGNFSEAKRICPWDEAAHDAWDRARRGLDNEQEIARQRENEQSREEIARRRKQEQREQAITFDLLMLEGRKALDKQQYDVAVVSFAQAMHLRPDLAEPAELRKQAERSRDDLDKAQSAVAKARADKLIRESQVAFQRSETLQREQALQRRKDDAERDLNLMQQLVLDANVALATHDFGKAIELAGKGKLMQPLDLRFGTLFDEAKQGQKTRLDAIERDRLLIQELKLAKDDAQKRRLEDKQRAETVVFAKEKENRQRLGFELMLKEGRQAMTAGRFDLALVQFEGARRLQPNHPELLQWIPKARKQREAFNQNVAQEQQKRAEEVALAQAVSIKQKEKVDEFQAEQAKIRQQQRRSRDFEQAMIEGKVALGKGKFDIAVQQFDMALQLRGDDPKLAKLREQAQAGQEEQAARKAKDDERVALERARQNEEAKQRQADRALVEQERSILAQAKKQQQDFDTQLKRGQDALGRKKLDQAVVAFSQALALQPNDAAAKEGLQLARELRDASLAQAVAADEQRASDRDAAAAKQREKQAERNAEQLVKFGEKALSRKEYDSAHVAFTQALQIRPDDAAAKLGLDRAREGRQQFVSQQSASSDEARQRHELRKAEEDAQRKAVADAKASATRLTQQKHDLDAQHLTKLLATARAGIELRQFDAASAALDAARRITPDDPAIARLLRDMDLAKTDAANAKVREALKLLPLDTSEQKALEQARFDLRLGEGRRHLEARRFDDAVRELEAALRSAPLHAEARELLAKANRR